VGDIGG
jgi:hypothetical protein